MSNPNNLDAFIYAIERAEHTASDVASGLDWQTFYGGARFYDMSDHPVITGELQPVRLPDRFCAASGLAAPCYSTAAGGLQITRPTWARVRQSGAWGPYLADFSIDSQKEAGRRLLGEAGALPFIESGDIPSAVAAASHLWASLPGSTAAQGGRSMDWVTAAFDEGLARTA